MINDVWIFEQKKVIHDVCAAVATTPVQTKGQLISKLNFEVFELKNERKYFCISALASIASKMGQIIKNNGLLSY